MTVELHLKIVGALLILLALAHLTFAKRFNWKTETERMSLLNRQIFYVHCFFISLVLVFMGALSLFSTRLLLQPGELNKLVLIALIVFWSARLFIQFFVYDARLWKDNRFNTAMHVLFSAFWAYCVATFGMALWRQFAN
jgi:hypothetical protein